MTAAIPEPFLEPLRRALGWLLTLRDAEGRIVCPEHRIEHTGKSAGAAVLAARLAKHDRPEFRAAHVAAAIQQGRRLVANLYREGESACHTFWPGRHDKFNSSNAVIDGGACSDALAELVQQLGPELPADDARAFRDASLLHARTYLRYAVLDKGIPAQRAWGLSGLAAAWSLEHDAELEQAALQALGALEGVQHSDGSFPYHPLEWGAEHPGASDVSSFYHSRIPGFALFALERLGRDVARTPFAPALRRALDFAEALHGPDGLKCGLVEAKPWYWGAEYEVASHVFDVYALLRGWKLFGEPRFARAALRAFRTWSEHLLPTGQPRSHLDAPGRTKSYQCPVFWACHAEWIARALPELVEASAKVELNPRGPGAGIDLSIRWFPDAQLARLEDDRIVAWVRGARPPYNVHHGSPHGSGLLRVVRKLDGANLLARQRLSATQEGEWSGHAGSSSLARGWSHGAKELRFALWLVRNHARGRRLGMAASAPLEALRHGVLDFASREVSSAFDRGPVVSVDGEGVTVESTLALRGGEVAGGAWLRRRFEIDGTGLTVGERVLDGGSVEELRFRWPALATERSGDGRTEAHYRLA